MMPDVNGLHYDLKQEFLMRNNISFHQDQQNNQTWLSGISRPITISEITLMNFFIYAKELDGQESFELLCLNSTIFSSDGEKRKCVENKIINLPQKKLEA